MRCYFVQLIVQLSGNFCFAARTSAARPDWAFSGVLGKSVPPEEEIFREITGPEKGVWATPDGDEKQSSEALFSGLRGEQI